MAEQLDNINPKRNVLMALAVEGIVPVLGGCAGALAGGPEAGMIGGVVGVAVGQAVEKAINFFGGRIVLRWSDWFRKQPPQVQQEALAALAATPPEEARKQAESLLDKMDLSLAPADREAAVGYLTLLPGAIDRALPRDIGTGGRSLPPTMSVEEPQQLLALLPQTLPPYGVGSDVPGTPYHLESLLGSGGFGAVYRARTKTLQHLPLAVKFCLDPTLTQALHRERDNLERLMKAGGHDWSPRVVRLYGYDLEHPTPYLVYEFVTGGDLLRHLAEERVRLGRPPNAGEVLALVTQIAEALAFAHAHGLVHRDLKPANVLVEAGVLKLADFGLGGIAAARAAQGAKIGMTTIDNLSAYDQATLFRGAGTPLYMAPEQRRGQPADPRHDLYSLGVLWYQLLVGDVSRELHPGWAKELSLRYGVPREHLDLIDACVGWIDERPKHAGELLAKIRLLGSLPSPILAPSPPADLPSLQPASAKGVDTAVPLKAVTQAGAGEEMRESFMLSLVGDLHQAHDDFRQRDAKLWGFLTPVGVVSGIAFFVMMGEMRSPWAAIFGTLLLSAASGGVAYVYALGRRTDALDRVKATADTLEREFPQTVAEWGGSAALLNAEMVEKISGRLGVGRPKGETALNLTGLPRLDAERRGVLKGMLARLGELKEAAANFVPLGVLPWWLVALIAFVVGAGAGGGAFAAHWEYNGPIRFREFINNPEEFYTSDLATISAQRYDLDVRRSGVQAALVGLSVAAAAGCATWFLLAGRRWYRRHLLTGFLIGAGLGAAVGGLAAALVHEYHGPRRFQEFFNKPVQYLGSQGETLSYAQYRRDDRSITVTCVLTVCGSCLAAGVAGMLLFQRWYAGLVRRAHLEVGRAVSAIDDAFPDVTFAVGGPDRLKLPGAVTQLLKVVG